MIFWNGKLGKVSTNRTGEIKALVVIADHENLLQATGAADFEFPVFDNHEFAVVAESSVRTSILVHTFPGTVNDCCICGLLARLYNEARGPEFPLYFPYVDDLYFTRFVAEQNKARIQVQLAAVYVFKMQCREIRLYVIESSVRTSTC